MAARKSKARYCDETPVNVEGVSDGELLARLSKALAHPARVPIVRMLIERAACVCEEMVGGRQRAKMTGG